MLFGADGRGEPQLCGVGSLRQPSGSPGGEVSRSVSQQRRTHLPVRLPDNHPLRHEDQDPEGTDAPERATHHFYFLFKHLNANLFLRFFPNKKKEEQCSESVFVFRL